MCVNNLSLSEGVVTVDSSWKCNECDTFNGIFHNHSKIQPCTSSTPECIVFLHENVNSTGVQDEKISY